MCNRFLLFAVIHFNSLSIWCHLWFDIHDCALSFVVSRSDSLWYVLIRNLARFFQICYHPSSMIVCVLCLHTIWCIRVLWKAFVVNRNDSYDFLITMCPSLWFVAICFYSIHWCHSWSFVVLHDQSRSPSIEWSSSPANQQSSSPAKYKIQ